MGSSILEIPTKDPVIREEYLWASGDSVARKVVSYLLEKEKAYFNQMSKDFTTSDVATRNTLFGRLLRMEKAGIVQADLVRIDYGEEKIQKWVKEYKLPEQSMKWAKSLANF
jgi:hypothetical protein